MNIENIPDIVQHKLGEKLAEIMLLKRSRDYKDRYVLGGGHNTKTAIGVFRTAFDVTHEQVKKEKKKTHSEIIGEYCAAYFAANQKQVANMYYIGHGWFMLQSDPAQPADRIRLSAVLKATEGLKARVKNNE